MTPVEVIQIVPTLPPRAEGVGSFALALAEALSASSGARSRFLVADRGWSPPGKSGADARVLPAADPEALRAALSQGGGSPVLLHYAGYGYHPRGCPAWLVEGLRRWKQTYPERRLVTVFHEVYATGWPWRSSFWLSPVQRRLAGRLAQLSDGLVTSVGLYGRMLRRRAPYRQVTVLPVFSAVGEPEDVPPLCGRARRLVLFGGAGTRRRAYERLEGALANACRALDVEEVCDVGPPGPTPGRVAERPVRRLGPLPAGAVRGLLRESLAGFVAYPAALLAKSTIFAAYCAHGLLPVSAWDRPRRRTDPPPPYWPPRPEAPGRDELQGIADRARTWYAGHALASHTALYRELLACAS